MIENTDAEQIDRLNARVVELLREIERRGSEYTALELAFVRACEEATEHRNQLGKAQEALSPFAAISLWRDLYPDAKDDFPSDRRMQGMINPDHVRAARAASSKPDDQGTTS